MGRRVMTATLDGTASAGACSYPCRLKLLVCLECLPQSLAPSDWVQKPPADLAPTTYEIGNLFLTTYVLPFEVASIVLLAALIGAVAVSRKEVRG